MTDTSREAFEAWHKARANNIRSKAVEFADRFIREGSSDSPRTHQIALYKAIDTVDETGWGAWQASRTALEAEQAQAVEPACKPSLYIHKDQLAFLRTVRGDESAQARYANGFPNWIPDSVKAEFQPLYTPPAPPPASAQQVAVPVRQPLTNKQKMTLATECGVADSIGMLEAFELGVSHAERYHSITQGEKP